MSDDAQHPPDPPVPSGGAFPIERRLVVAVASSALFDLDDSDSVFREHGQDAYRAHQWERRDQPLPAGVALPFVRRFLSLNDAFPDDPPVEVVLLSRNSPETGLRVFASIAHHDLGITRAAFTNGQAPWPWLPGFGASLFLSADPRDVVEAIAAGHAAGTVLPSAAVDDPDDRELRVAFDFDGVLADDESERVYRDRGLAAYHEHESARATTPLNPGPLGDFFVRLGALQARLRDAAPSAPSRLRLALVTARNAPAIERCITTLRAWGVEVDDTFFLGGVDKARILRILQPHVFFDDQPVHLATARDIVPAVHVPFGITNA